MGLTQHRFGVDNVKAVVNLALARGMLGREKCGIMPIRGHSGVQGGGECGVDPDKYPGGFEVAQRRRPRAASRRCGARRSRRGRATARCRCSRPRTRGEIDFLYSLGGNLLETMPDRAYMREALSRVRLRVHQDIVLNTSALLAGPRRAPAAGADPLRDAGRRHRDQHRAAHPLHARDPGPAHRRGAARVGDPGARRDRRAARAGAAARLARHRPTSAARWRRRCRSTPASRTSSARASGCSGAASGCSPTASPACPDGRARFTPVPLPRDRDPARAVLPHDAPRQAVQQHGARASATA